MISGAVTEEEQLLSPLTEQDTVDSPYEPVFIDEILVDSLPPETMEICGTNKQCQFDYHVTRKESVAKSTAAFTNKFEALKEELEKKGKLGCLGTICISALQLMFSVCTKCYQNTFSQLFGNEHGFHTTNRHKRISLNLKLKSCFIFSACHLKSVSKFLENYCSGFIISELTLQRETIPLNI